MTVKQELYAKMQKVLKSFTRWSKLIAKEHNISEDVVKKMVRNFLQ